MLIRFKRLCLCYCTEFKFRFCTGKFQHLLLNFLEILFTYSFLTKVNIVIEAFFNGRSYGQFCMRVEVYNGLREYVR